MHLLNAECVTVEKLQNGLKRNFLTVISVISVTDNSHSLQFMEIKRLQLGSQREVLTWQSFPQVFEKFHIYMNGTMV